MKKDDIIRIARSVFAYYDRTNDEISWEDRNEAFEAIIKALEQKSRKGGIEMSYCDTCIHHEVCGLEGVDDEGMTYCADRIEPRDDVISRQAMLDKAFEIKTGEYTSAMVVYAHDIRKLPSVTPQPKTGRWITKPHVYGVTYCSECDFELKIDDTNFCPNCGAKMVELQESEVEE